MYYGKNFHSVNSSQPWLLLPFVTASGSIQMAIDEWLLTQHSLGKIPSVIRFYRWEPVALSLGYHQQEFPEFWHHLFWQNQPIDLVKRATGGRAVLHQGDLTYMVITSELLGNRREVYHQICQFLILGWRSLGVNLSYGKAGKDYINCANCFATSTGADLVIDPGYKLIGSAQVRKGKSVLQHGSILLEPEPDLFGLVFGVEAEQQILATRQILSSKVSQTGLELQNIVIDALTQALTECFQIQLIDLKGVIKP